MNNFNCGRLFLTGINGTTISDEEKLFIEENELAGVVLFSKNFENKEQLRSLTSSIQNLGQQKKIIAVDHEGGRVQRFRDDFSLIPSVQEIANTNSPTFCFETHEKIAEELKDVGINLNLAPALIFSLIQSVM